MTAGAPLYGVSLLSTVTTEHIFHALSETLFGNDHCILAWLPCAACRCAMGSCLQRHPCPEHRRPEVEQV